MIALYCFGPALGGPESARWGGLFQLLLTGWVIYVGALGLLGEAILLRTITASLVVGIVAILIYLRGATHLARILFRGQTQAAAGEFVLATLLVCAWSTIRFLVDRRPRPARHSE